MSWGPPTPLGRSHAVEVFPVACLPTWLADYVRGLAEATQTPVDLSGAMVLAALATAAGGRAVVEARPGWREPLNLFIAVAMPPGSRKSAVVAEIAQPLQDAERRMVESAGPLILEAVTRRRAAEDAAAKAIRSAGTDSEAVDEAIRAAQMAEAVTVPAEPRLLADDATPEALTSLLAEQRGRVAVLSAEGDIFDMMAGRYSRTGPTLAVYLKGHTGDTLRVDRKGRPAEYIAAPALTLGLAIQPDVLRTIAAQRSFRGRGLLARFLFVVPPNNVGSRRVGAGPLRSEVRDRYTDNLRALVLSLAEWEDPAVQLTPDAHDLLLAFEAELEPQLGPAGRLGHIADWGAKLAGAAVRIAGLLHLAEQLRTGWSQPVEALTMRSAVTLARWCIGHALTAFDYMSADPELDDARVLRDWLVRKSITEFTQRDAHREHQARFRKAADLARPLDVLEAHHIVRQRPLPPPAPTGGRPPSPTFDVNPGLHDTTDATDTTSGSVTTVSSVSRSVDAR